MKFCNGCLISKDAKDFYKRKASRDGLSRLCKKCCKLHNRFYYEGKKQDIKERMKDRYQENPEKFLSRNSDYAKSNPAKVNSIHARHKAAKRQRVPSWLTETHYQQIEIFYDAAVKLTEEFGIKMEVDHIIPLQGTNVSGLHVPWNLQVISQHENCSKGNRYE